MSKVYTSADQLIGHTPLLELTHLEKKYNLEAKVIERLNTSIPQEVLKIELQRICLMKQKKQEKSIKTLY